MLLRSCLWMPNGDACQYVANRVQSSTLEVFHERLNAAINQFVVDSAFSGHPVQLL